MQKKKLANSNVIELRNELSTATKTTSLAVAAGKHCYNYNSCTSKIE